MELGYKCYSDGRAVYSEVHGANMQELGWYAILQGLIFFKYKCDFFVITWPVVLSTSERIPIT